MYVIPEKKLCYLAAPRTGSKATATALREQCGAVLLGSHHHTPAENCGVLSPDWTVISTVRNHWDTLVSWWFKLRCRKPLARFIKDFVANNPLYVQNGNLWHLHYPYTTHTLRYETLEISLNEILASFDLQVTLPKIIDSKRTGRYQLYYDQATAQWVGDYFRDEITQYGYRYGD